jgi:hypothetical protein
MRVFAISIEHALDVAIECPQHADARMHQEVATFGGADQINDQRRRAITPFRMSNIMTTVVRRTGGPTGITRSCMNHRIFWRRLGIGYA